MAAGSFDPNWRMCTDFLPLYHRSLAHFHTLSSVRKCILLSIRVFWARGRPYSFIVFGSVPDRIGGTGRKASQSCTGEPRSTQGATLLGASPRPFLPDTRTWAKRRALGD